jgi:MFS family permease
MLAVAVEWEIYARTHWATALGLVGLAIAVPVVTLSLPAGHLADRFSRKATLAILSAITSTVPASAFMETACHSLTAETALREQTIDVYRVDFRRLAAFHPRHQKISGA